MDLRKHTRHRVRFRSSFSCRGQVAGEGTLLDLSVRGCRISSKTGVAKGTGLELRLYLPPENQESPLVIQQAEVIWIKQSEFGVQFTQLGGETQETIRSFIKNRIPII
jgi:hypothetical protein